MTYTLKARMQLPPVGREDGAGVDHNIFIAVLDEEIDNNILHWSCVIPTDRFDDLLESLTNSERIALYKTLIIEFYGKQSTPYNFEDAPISPTPPSSLSDLGE